MDPTLLNYLIILHHNVPITYMPHHPLEWGQGGDYRPVATSTAGTAMAVPPLGRTNYFLPGSQHPCHASASVMDSNTLAINAQHLSYTHQAFKIIIGGVVILGRTTPKLLATGLGFDRFLVTNPGPGVGF